MTPENELKLLEALDKADSETPKYKKMYYRDADPRFGSITDLESIHKEVFPSREAEFCNHLSLEEWEQIPYDLEIRDKNFYVKYLKKE